MTFVTGLQHSELTTNHLTPVKHYMNSVKNNRMVTLVMAMNLDSHNTFSFFFFYIFLAMRARLSSIKTQAFESMLNSSNVSYRNTNSRLYCRAMIGQRQD